MNTKYSTTHRRIIEVAALAPAVLCLLSFCSPQFSTPARGENPPLLGATSIGVGPAPVLGVVIDRNMRVVSVEAGGAAEKGGIKVGDVLKTINSKSVKQPSAARKAFYSRNSSQKSKLIVLRDGTEITLEIEPTALVGKRGQPTPTPVPQDMTYF